ncbi:MAG TPA: EAL domain-containing protein [Dongiaceae bacterium]|nr:EAL domain-containing protein [Dongiaceae bacterium]
MKRRPSSLRILVVLVLTGTLLVLGGGLLWSQYLTRKERTFEDIRQQLRTQLMMTQARVERDLASRNLSGAASEVVMLKLLDDVQLTAVVDELGTVRFSSNFVIVDQPAASQLHQFNNELFQQVQRNGKALVVIDRNHVNLFAYYPVIFSRADSNLRPDRVGALFVHWSLARPYRFLQQQAWREAGYLALLLIVTVTSLLWLLQRRLLQPLRRLQQKIEFSAGGQDVPSFHDPSVTEVAGLGHALDRLRQYQHAGLQTVRRSEERWLFALEAASQGVYDCDLVSGQTFYSPQCRKILGLDPAAVLGADAWMTYVPDEDRHFVERRLQRHFQGLSDLCMAEYRVQPADGSQRYVLMRGRVMERRADGAPMRFIATYSDVTNRRRMEDALRGSEEKYRRLFEMAQEGIWVIDADGVTTIVNEAMANMLGYKREEMIGRHLFDFMDEDARRLAQENMKRRSQGIEEQHDFEFLSSNGRRVYTTMQTAPVFDANGVYAGAIAGVIDITERKRAEARILQQALFDELTQLPNRRLLNDRLSQEQARALRHQHTGALLFIDLDHFKNVNDSLGHPVGDALLIEIAKRLQRVVREEDTLARLGGDEFVVLLPELDPEPAAAAAQARSVGLKMQDALTETFDIDGHRLNISCSIGIALYPLEQESIHDIIKQADAAMYRAKQEGRSTLCIFNKEMHEAIERNLRLQMLLPGALAEQQFELHYQAQFNHRRELIGAEALLRWQEPELGWVRPDLFIRAAEESGFIVPLGDWVLRSACEQLRQWQERGLPASFQRLAINISARQFAQDDFPQRVLGFTRAAGVEPGQIELEVTESMLLNRLEQVVEKMRALHEMGFYIALDDFGTGYSSLSYLRSLPLHKLKIDRAFVRDIQHDRNDRAIVETIIAMARHMELDVIAEGVEDEQQFEFLQEKGCLQYQGYYFARPVAPAAFNEQWLPGD